MEGGRDGRKKKKKIEVSKLGISWKGVEEEGGGEGQGSVTYLILGKMPKL